MDDELQFFVVCCNFIKSQSYRGVVTYGQTDRSTAPRPSPPFQGIFPLDVPAPAFSSTLTATAVNDEHVTSKTLWCFDSVTGTSSFGDSL